MSFILSVANKPIILSVVMPSVLSVIMLCVIMLSVIMLSVIRLSVGMLSVGMLSVVAPFQNAIQFCVKLFRRCVKPFHKDP